MVTDLTLQRAHDTQDVGLPEQVAESAIEVERSLEASCGGCVVAHRRVNSAEVTKHVGFNERVRNGTGEFKGLQAASEATCIVAAQLPHPTNVVERVGKSG